MEAKESRLEVARRRIRIARYSIGALATAAFAMIGLAARNAHPATHTRSAPSVSTRVVRADDTQDDGFSFDGGGFIAPSTSGSTPTIQSGGS